mmetsp:Transcript_97910/g.204203  ORF Transcript_97910/g.204203 Transcript_97910/m.204203 type:complete len:413 (-) Transcript_97910:256-1494(-)
MEPTLLTSTAGSPTSLCLPESPASPALTTTTAYGYTSSPSPSPSRSGGGSPAIAVAAVCSSSSPMLLPNLPGRIATSLDSSTAEAGAAATPSAASSVALSTASPTSPARTTIAAIEATAAALPPPPTGPTATTSHWFPRSRAGSSANGDLAPSHSSPTSMVFATNRIQGTLPLFLPGISGRRNAAAQEATLGAGSVATYVTDVGLGLVDSVELAEMTAMHRRAEAFSFSGMATPSASTHYHLSPRRGASSRGCLLRPARIVRSLSNVFSPGGTTHFRAAVWPNDANKEWIPVAVQEVCAICLEPFASGDEVQPMVRCSHFFHEACIEEFLRSQGRQNAERSCCPLCRGGILAQSLSEMPEFERAAARHFRWPSQEDGTSGSLSGSINTTSGLGSSQEDERRRRHQTTIFAEW